MKFGLFYEWPNPNLRNWTTLFEEGVEQIQYSEEMGFEYCLIAEHHFSNYGNSPAPLMQALYIGQRTRKLQIATGIIVVPIWDVLRLAEEVAVLDNLIDGRFICGVGRGYQPTKCLALALPWRTRARSLTKAWRYWSRPGPRTSPSPTMANSSIFPTPPRFGPSPCRGRTRPSG